MHDVGLTEEGLLQQLIIEERRGMIDRESSPLDVTD